MDALYIGGTLVIFLVSVLLVHGLDRLGRKP
jgi:hypothetical protein